jgi:hypothetical protein
MLHGLRMHTPRPVQTPSREGGKVVGASDPCDV